VEQRAKPIDDEGFASGLESAVDELLLLLVVPILTALRDAQLNSFNNSVATLALK
jgi:hypothetical protein